MVPFERYKINMAENNEVTIRTVKASDIGSLKSFFIKAYGERTVFQNDQFLLYYFDSRSKDLDPLSASLIGLSPEMEIVSHYGGLFYNLKINNEIHQMIWGVSAFTLPEWRGKGFNSKIVDLINENNEINGVIGFSRTTASFYQKLGYNIFDFERFTRYVQILNQKKTLEVIKFIKKDSYRFRELLQIPDTENNNSDFRKVIELTKENIWNYELNLDEDLTGITTTHRTREFLIWRFFENPTIKYKVYAFSKDDTIQTYIALREENLEPINYKVNRIIDLYGKKVGISILLDRSIQESVSKNHIYIDFSMFGTVYEKELAFSQFIKLENDDCCILPLVTSPIEDRPNGEYIGIKSKYLSKKIENLTKDKVYFTRIDSDRDRSAKTSN